MISALIALALLTLCGLAAAYLLHRTLEATLPVVMLGGLMILYSFYACNQLMAGRILLIAVYAGVPAAALVRMVRRRDYRAFFRNLLFTPQMAVYLGLIALFFVLSLGKQVGIWDTMRLWGALPKALHAYGTLQFGDHASLFVFSQSYPPLVPLWGALITSFSPVFSEAALFFARACFGLILLLPLTRFLTWSRWHGLIPVVFCMVLVPYYLTTNDPDFAFYYESLYVDAPAGILCGYLCWLAMEDCYKDWFSTAAFCLALSALTLTKDFGVLLGGLCLLGSFSYTWKAARTHTLKTAVWKPVAAAVSLLCAYLSWQLLLMYYHVANYNTVTATIPTLHALTASFGYFAASAITINLSVASLSLTFGAYLLALALGYALFVYRDKALLRHDAPFILLRLLGYGGYFFAYVMMFRDDIAGGVFPSIGRYMVAMLLCEAYVFGMAALRTSHRRSGFLFRPFSALRPGGKTAALLLAVLLAALGVFTIGTFWKYDGGVYQDAATAAELVEQNVQMPGDEIADVWLLIGGDPWENSLLHHRIYFDLIGSRARIKPYILETNITSGGLAYTPDTFLRMLAEGSYEYVLLVYGDDMIVDEFGRLFPELVPYETDFLLYRVMPAANGAVTLQLVP